MWKLLSETRSRCLYASMIGASVVTLFVLIQSITGKLAPEDLPFAWTWVAVNLLPGLALLWVNVLRQRTPAKLVHPAMHRALVWGTWGYTGMLLLTFLALGGALQQGNSVVGYFRSSWFWLLPAQLVLVGSYVLAFYRKESVFRPGEQVITAFSQQKAAEWQQKGNTARQQCFELVAANDMPAAFDALKAAFDGKNTPNHHATITLESQYTELQRQINMNAIEPAQAQIHLNRIAMGVLNLIEAL